MIGGGVYLYKNADVMIEEARENVANAAVEAVSGALPGLIDAAMPDIPVAFGTTKFLLEKLVLILDCHEKNKVSC